MQAKDAHLVRNSDPENLRRAEHIVAAVHGDGSDDNHGVMFNLICIMLQMDCRHRGPGIRISRYGLRREMYNLVMGTRDPRQAHSGVRLYDVESLEDGPVKGLAEEASS